MDSQMVAYRLKNPDRATPKTRKDVIIQPEDFTRGRTVWVPDEDGIRREYVCTGQNGDCVPIERWRELMRYEATLRDREYRLKKSLSSCNAAFRTQDRYAPLW